MSASAGVPPNKVILVHGLWLSGWSMRPLAWRLGRRGLDAHCHSYRSVSSPFDHCARNLAATVAKPGDTTMLVGHSLGGLVVLRALQYINRERGRVVLLGSPIGGSVMARRMAMTMLGKWVLGEAEETLCATAEAPPAGWEIGMVAGNLRVGLGAVLGGVAMAGDGTVALSETKAPWLTDHITLAESHSTLQLSHKVADLTADFLRGGSFHAKKRRHDRRPAAIEE